MQFCWLFLVVFVSGCLGSSDGGGSFDGGTDSGAMEGSGTGGSGGSGGDGDAPRVVRPRPVVDAGRMDEVPDASTAPEPAGCSEPIKKLDLLFIIDDSQSMRQEQEALRDRFSSMVTRLVVGGVSDMHLGVVSTDMGLVDVTNVPNCGGFGKDGVLQHVVNPGVGAVECEPTYPTFLSYTPGTDLMVTARDIECIATLGTDGCGFEQPLEAGLKALWPSVDSRITFLEDSLGNGGYGHGDGLNAGFLRDDSMLGIVLLTDENDCSARDTGLFIPGVNLPEGHPLKNQPINLRCFYNATTHLQPVSRYIEGLRLLRPGNEGLVVFTAITGVPADLVVLTPNVDLDNAATRGAWYDRIMSDQRMVERPDETQTDITNRNLVPSCETSIGKAFPPRRIVEVARGFGRNGLVQSICQADFSDVTDGIVDLIVRRMQDCGR